MPMSWEQNYSIVAWNGTGITTQIDAEPINFEKIKLGKKQKKKR